MNTSTNNIGIGIGALTQNRGNDNIAIGRDALKYNTDGDYNIAIGKDSGSSENMAIFNTFSYNTFIGYQTSIDPNPLTEITTQQQQQISRVDVQNSTAIGYQAKIFEEKQIVLGTASDYVYIPKQMSIGKVGTSNQISRKPADGVGLDVSGSLLVSGNINGNDITGNNMIMNGDISGNGDLFVGGDISGNGNLFVRGNIYKNGVEINSNNFAANQVKALYSDEYKNTYVGSNTKLLGGSGYQGIERSTTIGYGANIDLSNQIVLGTSNERVDIPGKLFVKGTEITGSGGGGSDVTNLTSDQYENTYVGNNTTLMGGPGYGRSFQNVKNSTAIGYGSNITLSKQIVLGTSGEFVCIPSNRGLSIGKTTAPTSGIALDVSGSVAINYGSLSYNNYSFVDASGTLDVGPGGEILPSTTLFLTTLPKLNISLFTNWDDQEIGLGFYNELIKAIPIDDRKLSTWLNNLFIRDVKINNTQTKYDVNNGFLNLSMGIRSLSNLIDNTDMTLNRLYTPMCQYNTSVGNFSQLSNTTGFMNTSLGAFSMPNNINGSNNTAIGYKAGYSDTSGSFNTYLGANTHTRDINDIYPIYNYSTAIGYNAVIDASNQIVLGTDNENVLVRGTMNVNKLLKLDNGLNLSGDFNFLNKYDNNSYIYSKLEMNNGRDNAYMKLDASTCSITLSGPNSGITINSRKITSFAGIENVTDTSNNIRIGTDVLSINRGNNNTAIGYKTLYYNETGGANTAIGYNAGYYAGSSYNTFLGSYTDISSNETNIQNSTALGYNAKIDASNQIVLGTSNERVDIPGKLFVNNVEITSSGGGGTSTGANSDANNNTFLGTNTNRSDTSILNSTAIGYNAKVDASNQIVLGTSGEFVCIPSNRGLSIGKTTAPASNYALDVSGSIFVSGNIGTGNNTKIGSVSGNNCSLGVNIKYVGSGYDSSYNPPSNSNYPPFNNDYLCEINGNNLVIKNLSVDARTIWSLLLTSTKPLPYSKSTPRPGRGGVLIGDINSTSSNVNVIYTLNDRGIDQIDSEFLSDDNLCLYIVFRGSSNILNSLSTLTINFNNSIDNINVYMFASRAKVNTYDSYLSTLKLNYTSTDNLTIFNYDNTQRETPQLAWSYIIGSNNNTFVGSNSDCLSNIQINNSTALGYQSKIDVSNQIVLGTSGEFICIPSNRGLSIGKTTAPASGYALDVVGSINFSGSLYQNGSIFVSGGGGGSGTSNSITGDFFVSQDISCNGDLDITGDISGNGDLFVRGSVEASSYNATSDYRIKDNVRNLDDSDTIINLRPVKYVNKLSNKNDFGLIAHELQIEYPDLVSGSKDGTEYQSVNYTGLISILIKEIQDLKRITSNQTIKLESQATQLERINKLLFPND